MHLEVDVAFLECMRLSYYPQLNGKSVFTLICCIHAAMRFMLVQKAASQGTMCLKIHTHKV